MAALPPVALPQSFLTTQEVLVLCGIDDSTVINTLIQDMLSPLEGIRHLQDEYSDRIQSACSGYARRTSSNGKFTVSRVRQKCLSDPIAPIGGYTKIQ